MGGEQQVKDFLAKVGVDMSAAQAGAVSAGNRHERRALDDPDDDPYELGDTVDRRLDLGPLAHRDGGDS